jgi:hypothetical protein
MGCASEYRRWPSSCGISRITLGIQYVTLILHAAIIYISVKRDFDSDLFSPNSPWKIAKKVKATPWFPLASETILSPFMLFLQVTSLNSYPRRDFVIGAYVRPWTDILYRLQMFPTAIEPALAETAPRQG